MEKKNILLPISILVGCLLIAGAVFFAAGNFGYKMAFVDMESVIQKSELGKQINKQLESKGKELQGKLQLAKTDEEKNQIRYEFDKFKSDKQQEFYKKVKDIIGKTAKQKGVKAVPRPEMFIYCETDLTEDVIKELDK
ncbi:MAG TPA: hypothetical protein VEC37_12860 [Bacillota bacterium]|nr:hypothetical protein [Bacillota bacterium]